LHSTPAKAQKFYIHARLSKMQSTQSFKLLAHTTERTSKGQKSFSRGGGGV
jgi:hypothetical protein